MMNRIEKRENGYFCILKDGREGICERWYEKKIDGYHIKIPKEFRDICGRTFVRESHFEKSDIYEFEDKSYHREGIGNGGWKNRLTEEELEEYEYCEKRMSELKIIGMSRPVPELTEKEKLEREIERLIRKRDMIK